MTNPDIKISFAHDSKDNKWRWLVEVGDQARAGEERALLTSIEKADQQASDLILTFYPRILT